MGIVYKYGIDFGTTNSSIALRYDKDGNGLVSNNIFDVDALNLNGRGMLPSTVYLDVTGDIYVGTVARRKYGTDDLPMNLKTLITKLKLLLDKHKNDIEVANIGKRVYLISDVMALVIKELKAKADKYHIIKTEGIVFGVPVNYNEDCKRVMINSTVKAGLYEYYETAEKAVEFISEPIAVALDYGLELNSDKNVYVIDFGGGTLDLAVIKLKKQYEKNNSMHEVYSKDRITIGGELYTKLFFKEVFVEKCGFLNIIDAFRYDKVLSVDDLWNRLNNDSLGIKFIEALDASKCILSYADEDLFSFVDGDTQNDSDRMVRISCKLLRKEFEEAISDTFEDIRLAINESLRDSYLNPEEIDEVLMAGGSSLIPCIKNIVYDIFGRVKVREPNNNALTSIVKGLAVQGYQIDNNQWVSDIVDSNYGVWYEKLQRIDIVIPRNTKISDTKYDKDTASGGKYKDVKASDDLNPTIKVYQDSSQVGEFTLPFRGSGYYRIFYEVDDKHGWLIVHVYDRMTAQWYDNVLEHNIIKLIQK